MNIISESDIKEQFSCIYDFLYAGDMKTLRDGRYDLDRGIYANVQSYNTEPRESRKFETHRRYVDLQFMIEGAEIISTRSAGLLKAENEYDIEKDIIFYKNEFSSNEGITDNLISSGNGILLFPQDVHMPCIKDGGAADNVRKIVFKIPLPYFHNIKYLFMDVDGTLTDGKIYMGNDGEVMKAFDIKDGYGIKDIAVARGIKPVIITGRESMIVRNRCREIGIDAVYQGVKDKISKVTEIAAEAPKGSTAYIGDDMPDLPVMKMIKEAGGLIGCPSDSVKAVIDMADFIAPHSGGNGAVRDFIEWLCQ